MGTGACKYFSANHVRDIALEKFGSVEELMRKADAKNKRKSNKADKDRLKRLEEEHRRKAAAEAVEIARIAATETKKQAAAQGRGSGPRCRILAKTVEAQLL
jgi:hypothetical protein